MTRALALAGLVIAVGACEEPDLSLPSPEQVESYYVTGRVLSAELNGNVAEVIVTQPGHQLRRGGRLWAKVGPYVFLFSDATRSLFEDYPGLAGVRVITREPGGSEVARALLHRDELNGVTWRRALNISGKARLRGGTQMTLLEDLVRWGEDHTEFEYSPTYVSRR